MAHLSLMSLQWRPKPFILLLMSMWKVLHGKTSHDLNIQFVSRPRRGNLAVIPSKSQSSSAAIQSLFDQSFAMLGPILWNAMPHHLNSIQDPELFKCQLIKFMLSIPGMPPIRGNTPPNNTAVLEIWSRIHVAVGWSDNLMASSSLDRTLHRSHT